jgi:hypothetical protein
VPSVLVTTKDKHSDSGNMNSVDDPRLKRMILLPLGEKVSPLIALI